MKYLLALLTLAMATPSFASDLEFEISFYFQPDDTGNNTLNKSIEIDGDEITIEESRNEGNNRYIERTATAEEIALVQQFVRTRIADFQMEAGPDVDAPKVEIEFEFDGGTRSIEVEEEYATGQVPKDYVALQNRFFEDAFE